MPDDRAARLTTALGDRLRFRRLLGEEALSRPFRFDLELASDDEAIAFNDVLGTAMAVEVPLTGGGSRWLHGLVSRFVFTGWEGGEARYQATLRPWLWFLCRTSDCRIFQEKSVPEIVRMIFAKHAGSLDVDVEERLFGSYAPRPYCVQYRESDFDFVDRLLQEEGITYFFTASSSKHTLVLADSPQSHRATPQYEEVPYFAKDEFARRERDHVFVWDMAAEVRSGRFAHTSFDFEKPRADLMARQERPMPHSLADGEIYDYDGRFTEPETGERAARLRLEADQASQRCAAGEGTAAGLIAGHRFRLARCPREDQNAEYVLREVSHELWDPAYRSGMADGEEIDLYRCRFTAMPAEIPYRPAQVTPKPRIRGPQTAMVTGPAGEEIWTDRHGRVKLQFHWDREGRHDDRSSCWIRVSQPWAGAGFGGIHIPRVGQEVIVEFIEGDPDMPIITGRVYNGQAQPPYALPANASQSGFKSNSTKGGAGSNELRFEDKKGQEEVYLHAQRNLQAVVEHDRTEHVKNNHTGTVEVDETLTVHGKRTRTVDKDETVTVHGSRTRTVDQAETVTVGKNRTRTVTGDETYTTKGDRTYTITGKDVLHVTKAQEVTLGAARSLTISDADVVKILRGKARLEAAANREVVAGETYKLNAKVIELTGTNSIKLMVGQSSIKIDDEGITLVSADGQRIKLN
jgi:type VI secretion system secreted protein VgrG